MKSARSACSSDPDWFAMNQVPACWATAARTCSSLGVTTSLHPRHSRPAMSQPLREVFLHHVRRYVETIADLLVAQAMAILKYDRGSTLGRELPEHRAQSRDTLRNVELPFKCRQLAELLLDARPFEVHAVGLPAIQHRVFLHEIARDGIEIPFRVANRLLIADSQHTHIDFLCEVRRVGFRPDAPIKERLQGTAVLREQSLDKTLFRFRHSRYGGQRKRP